MARAVRPPLPMTLAMSDWATLTWRRTVWVPASSSTRTMAGRSTIPQTMDLTTWAGSWRWPASRHERSGPCWLEHSGRFRASVVRVLSWYILGFPPCLTWREGLGRPTSGRPLERDPGRPHCSETATMRWVRVQLVCEFAEIGKAGYCGAIHRGPGSLHVRKANRCPEVGHLGVFGLTKRPGSTTMGQSGPEWWNW